jgi:hypothetical protein
MVTVAVAVVASHLAFATPIDATDNVAAATDTTTAKPADKPKSSSSSSSSSSNDERKGNAPTIELKEAGASSTPQGKSFGVGIQLGYPSAVTVKYMLRPDQGIVAGLGGLTGFNYAVGALELHVDYVWHPNVITSGDQYAVTWYIGAGGTVVVFGYPTNQIPIGIEYNYYPTSVWLGARMPIGLNVALAQLPFEVYLEADPQLLVFPGIGFGMGAAIGGRAYF